MSDVPEEFKWAETEIDNLIDLFGIPEDDNQRYYIQSLLEIKNSL
jgi:hypothetical protein